MVEFLRVGPPGVFEPLECEELLAGIGSDRQLFPGIVKPDADDHAFLALKRSRTSSGS